MKGQQLNSLDHLLHRYIALNLYLPPLLTEIQTLPIPKNQINGILKIPPALPALPLRPPHTPRPTHQLIEHRTLPVTQQHRILQLLFPPHVLLLLLDRPRRLAPLLLPLLPVLPDVVVEVLQTRAVEFTDLFKSLLQLLQLQLGQVRVQVFWD